MSLRKNAQKKGVLYVIATPIGNLDDITARARRIMSDVECVYAEDTRRTGQLCRHLGLHLQLRSLHEHNEEQRIEDITSLLEGGKSVGLVSDAGTPLINDPGFRVVAACHAAGITVSPVPGASALLAALCVCGLPTDRFSFRGFLPPRSVARRAFLEDLVHSEETTVVFESRHRILDSLTDISEVLGSTRMVCIARELTKTFETVVLDEVRDILEKTKINPDWQKGEFVLVIAAGPQATARFTSEVQGLLLDLSAELAPKRAASIVAKNTGLDKKDLYNWLVAQKQS